MIKYIASTIQQETNILILNIYTFSYFKTLSRTFIKPDYTL